MQSCRHLICRIDNEFIMSCIHSATVFLSPLVLTLSRQTVLSRDCFMILLFFVQVNFKEECHLSNLYKDMTMLESESYLISFLHKIQKVSLPIYILLICVKSPKSDCLCVCYFALSQQLLSSNSYLWLYDSFCHCHFYFFGQCRGSVQRCGWYNFGYRSLWAVP